MAAVSGMAPQLVPSKGTNVTVTSEDGQSALQKSRPANIGYCAWISLECSYCLEQ